MRNEIFQSNAKTLTFVVFFYFFLVKEKPTHRWELGTEEWNIWGCFLFFEAGYCVSVCMEKSWMMGERNCVLFRMEGPPDPKGSVGAKLLQQQQPQRPQNGEKWRQRESRIIKAWGESSQSFAHFPNPARGDFYVSFWAVAVGDDRVNPLNSIACYFHENSQIYSLPPSSFLR